MTVSDLDYMSEIMIQPDKFSLFLKKIFGFA